MDEKKEAVLTGQQIAVLDDIFKGNMSEEGAVRNHNVSKVLYRKWLGDDVFADEIGHRTAALERQSKLIIAKLTSYAAVKLVNLMNSDKTEIVRKACFDTISFPIGTVGGGKGSKNESPMDAAGQFDSELAGRLLEMLAEDK
jgi:hypothetical protein